MSHQFPGGDESSASAGVFTREEIECLEAEAIFEPQSLITAASGKRKVSAVFSPPSSLSISSSSSSSSASVRTWNFNPSTSYTFDIPIAEESVAALEFIGFVTPTAREIFQRYTDRPDPGINPDTLIDYVSGHICILLSKRYEDMEPREAMTRVGLHQQIQEALTDPQFSDIFWTQDLHFWIKDTLETNYATLLARQELLKNHASRRIAHKKRQKRSSLQGAFQQGSEPAGPQRPEVAATINMTPQDFQLPATQVAIETDSTILPGHVVLYKGKAFKELRPSRHPIIQDDGAINMSPLASAPGGDFNWSFNAHYWTPEKETAELYRQWAARRCPSCETCLIQIQIPSAFVSRLKSAELWYSRDWKQYVWTCKNQDRPDSKFDHLWKHGQADLVRGHICTGYSERITAIAKQDVDTKITEDRALRCPSTQRKAVQWMFLQDDTIDRLAVEVRGKMHIDIIAATGPPLSK